MPNLPPRHSLRPAAAKRHRLPETYDRPSAAKRGYGRQWQRSRLLHLARHPLCEQCLAEGRTVAATDVHHIIPKAQGGGESDANLHSLCHACHSRITRMEASCHFP